MCVCVCMYIYIYIYIYISGTALSKSAALWYKHTHGFLKATLGSSGCVLDLCCFCFLRKPSSGPYLGIPLIILLFQRPKNPGPAPILESLFSLLFQKTRSGPYFGIALFLLFQKTRSGPNFGIALFLLFQKTRSGPNFGIPLFLRNKH